MSDDELDPAFADFDLQRSPHSDDFGEGAGSSLGFSLGEGFGQPLRNGLDFELDHEGEFSGSEGGDGHGSPRSESQGSTPRRRTPKSNTPINPAVRMSLALELASASDGGNGRGRDLMQELGLEEDEEEQDAESESGNDYGRDEIALGGPLQLGEPLFDSSRNSSNEPSLNKTRQVNGTASRLRSRSSIAPLSSSTPSEQPSISPAETDFSPFDEDVLETAFRATASSLEESISSTATFISNLQSNLHGPSFSIPLETSSNSNGIDSHLSSSNLPLFNSSSLPSKISPDSSTALNYIDRQPLVEKSASTFVKTLYSFTKQREIQVRDITEMERVFARNEIGWGTVLSEMEPIPMDFEDADEDSEAGHHDSVSPSSSPVSSPNPISPSVPTSHLTSLDHNDGATTSGQHSDLGLSHLISSEFHHLRTLTTALLNAFASMSDVVQVQSALGQEASRKLRSLRAQVVTVRDELVSLDRSEGFIVDFEEQRRSGGKKRDFAKEAREIMKGVEEELQVASREAGNMLSLRT